MSISKTAVVLGITLIAMLGAISYLNTEGFHNLRGGDHDLRVALFNDWMREYNRSYSAGEKELRFKLWNEAYDFVQKHNSMGSTWEAGLNNFADITKEEFSSLYMGYRYDPNRPRENVVILEEEEGSPKTIDWRKKGAVTDVKDQKTCGSCYTFSSTGALEAIYKIKKGELVSLSEQQLLDCTSSYGNQGCNGGLMVPCFKYAKEKGVQKESDYPYESKKGSCRYKASGVVFKNTGYQEVAKNDYNQLRLALNKQTISVAVQANQDAWQKYKSGVISDNCGTELDHAVLAVGYEGNYWIVKNSWGPNWGEKGYLRIIRGNQNNGQGVCGINMEPSYPTLD